jgi:7-carboxy-7-deazaguanine synthase (Cx14CxxC type)
MYAVKEVYMTLQGEGAQAGRAAVFCRFSGCNLWSGLETDRSTAACNFCDTYFVGTDGPGGGKFARAEALANHIADCWNSVAGNSGIRYVVFTGGEPLLQLDAELISAMHLQGFEVGVETNGTQNLPPGLDWVCVSPKSVSQLRATSGHELKLVFPQPGVAPEHFAALDFRHFFLQPMDNDRRDENVQAATEYCLRNPQWRLSLQTHKLIGIR